MANIAAVLKAEVSRLARKEVRAEIESLKKTGNNYRRDIGELKRQVAQLERHLKMVSKTSARAESRIESAGDETGTGVRFSAKRLRSLRAKLGLSAADFGQLVGVSGQSVYHWEQEKSVPRVAQVQKLVTLRGVGRKEALARLQPAVQGRKRAG